MNNNITETFTASYGESGGRSPQTSVYTANYLDALRVTVYGAAKISKIWSFLPSSLKRVTLCESPKSGFHHQKN